MVTKYVHEVQNKGSPVMNTKDDLKVILTGGTDYVNKTVGQTAPTNWVVMFAVIMVVIAIVPLVPIAIAFIAGHYMNWWSSKNLK